MARHVSDRSEIRELIDTARSLYRSDAGSAYALAESAYESAIALDWKLGAAEALLVLSGAQHMLAEYSKAIRSATKALELFKIARNPLGVSDAHHRLAGLVLETGDHRAAVHHASAALKIRRERNDAARMADTLSILSMLYFRQAEFARSLEFALEELEASQRCEMPRTLAVAYTNLGAVYDEIGYSELARHYLEQAIEHWTMAHDAAGEAGGLYLLGKHLIRAGSIKEGQQHLQNSLTIFVRINEKLGRARVLAMLASTLPTKQRQKAISLLEEALELARAIKQPEILSEVLIKLSKLYQSEKVKAKTLLLEGLKLARTTADLRSETEALELLSICYERDGEYKFAYQTLQEHLKKKVLLLGHESSLELKALETRRELESIRSQAELHRIRAEDLANRVNEKERDLSMLALHLVEKQAFIGHLKRHLQQPTNSRQSLAQLVSKLEKEVQDESAWRTFEEEFEQLSGGFFKVLAAKHPDLTPSELKVCSLLRIGLSSKRIGTMLHISPSTVDTHRKHIRTKLALGDRKSLMGYLAGL